MSQDFRKSSVSTVSSTIEKMTLEEERTTAVIEREKKGLGFWMTSFFLVAQMAGAGFLSLPMAIANTGWIGVPMMIIFCISVGFAGTKLGKCWVILEERWPEQFAEGSRQPYMDIAAMSLGRVGRGITYASVVITLFGGTTVFLILTASFLENLIGGLSICEYVLVVAAVLTPLTFLGTPKDFWQASVLAVVSTALACLIIFTELLLETDNYPNPQYPNPTVKSFALGFGAILFAFGGASVFPTIQNDMSDRSQFSKSVVIGFIGILTLYLPVAVAGYAVQGDEVGSNILISVDTDKGIIKAAIGMEILNLLATYVISFNPVAQTLENQLHVEKKFGWKRCVVRSAIVFVEVVIGLAVPDFDKILNLIGGSTVTICTFVLPPVMYMRLVDMDSPKWTKRTAPQWERIFMWMIVCVGIVGGIVSTVSAFMDILDPDSLGASCFADFTPDEQSL